MHLRQLQDDQQLCMRAAAEALAEPVCPLVLDGSIEHALLKRLRREARVGLADGPAVVRLVDERRGHHLELGINLYRCTIDGTEVRLARVIAPRDWDLSEACYEFWAVPRRHYRRFYRMLRHIVDVELHPRRIRCSSSGVSTLGLALIL